MKKIKRRLESPAKPPLGPPRMANTRKAQRMARFLMVKPFESPDLVLGNSDDELKWCFAAFCPTLFVFLLTIAPGITWGHFGDDGGELTLAAAYCGVPHPSGYPLYVLLGKLFCFFPVGDYAFRTNLLSAVAGASVAAAATLIALIVNRRFTLGIPPWACAASGTAIALGKSLWSQSLITEVYSLSVALSLWTLAFFLKWSDGRKRGIPSGKWFFAASIGAGLAMGVHLTFAFMGIGFLSIIATTDKYFWKKRYFFYGLSGMIGVTILLYALLPILALKLSPINWGFIRSDQDFRDHVSGAQYRFRMFVFTGKELIERFQNTVYPLFLSQWGKGTFFLMCFGLGFGLYLCCYFPDPDVRRNARRAFFSWFFLWFPPFFYTLNYRIEDLPPYFCLPFTIFGFLQVSGIAFLIFFARDSNFSPKGLAVLIAFGCFIPLSGTLSDFQGQNLKKNLHAIDFGNRVFKNIPEDALIISDFDGRTNSLLYQMYGKEEGLKKRKLVLRTMLAPKWYRDHLRQLYPGLVLPEPSSKHIGLPWDDLCNHVANEILKNNPSVPRFVVKDTPQVTKGFFVEMSNGIFQIRDEEPKPDSGKFGERYLKIDFGESANSDYRGDPFKPGVRTDDSDHYPFLGAGFMKSPDGIPFWIAPPKSISGKPSTITTCYSSLFSTVVPLTASHSKALHFAVAGGVSRFAKGALALVKVGYEDGNQSFFNIEGITDYRDVSDFSLRFVSFPLEPRRIPKSLEIRGGLATSTREDFIPGVAIFAVTQER